MIEYNVFPVKIFRLAWLVLQRIFRALCVQSYVNIFIVVFNVIVSERAGIRSVGF